MFTGENDSRPIGAGRTTPGSATEDRWATASAASCGAAANRKSGFSESASSRPFSVALAGFPDGCCRQIERHKSKPRLARRRALKSDDVLVAL